MTKQPNYMKQEEVLPSKYDSGLSKIFRLNNAWEACQQYWIQGDLHKLNSKLEGIWIELATDAGGPNEEAWNKINTKLRLARKIKNVSLRSKMLSRLIKQKWTFLFKVEKGQGMGKSYVDPEEDNLD